MASANHLNLVTYKQTYSKMHKHSAPQFFFLNTIFFHFNFIIKKYIHADTYKRKELEKLNE